jgi:predicted lipoprotein with Yx(FWY)xxD motif
MDRSPRIAAIAVLALLLAAATLMAGCSQQQPLTVRVSDHPTYGKILTDSTGRSLYIQARDVPNTGAVANLGEVGRFYPPFYAERVSGGSGINITEFGYLTRADGQRQTTFRGWPLYYYINDREPGDAKSQGANNITFVAKPDYTVMVRENVTLGVYLTDTGGRPLVAQDGEASAGPALGYIPFRASPVVAPSPLVQTEDFGEARGSSGELQTTYRGSLLYAWSDGVRPGIALQNADGYSAVIVAPGGTLTGAIEAPTAAPSPSTTPARVGTTGTAVPVTTAQATAAETRSDNDAYTGGVYTPTPYRTVEVVRYSTASATPSVIWTPIPSGQATVVPTAPTVSALPTASALPTTPSPATPTTITTSSTTAVRTTLPPIRTPTPLPTSLPPTTIETTLPTTVPVPITTDPITTAPTLPISTTLPLPFPIASSLPPNPAIATQSGNAS